MQLHSSLELVFERVLNNIAANGREVNAWELECLRAAVIMMAMGDEDDAEKALDACQRGARDERPSTRPTLTVEDFTHLLTMLKARASDVAPSGEMSVALD